MKYLLALSCILCTLAVTVACSETPVIEIETDTKPDYTQNAINANRYLIEHEETAIGGYIDRRGWSVRQLACGARVHEYVAGQGSAIGNDDSVSVSYRVEDLAGNVLYDNRDESFLAGRMQPCEGLDAAILSLRHGSRAHVIVPSQAAFGAVGDGDAIPPRTPLMYTIDIK